MHIRNQTLLILVILFPLLLTIYWFLLFLIMRLATFRISWTWIFYLIVVRTGPMLPFFKILVTIAWAIRGSWWLPNRTPFARFRSRVGPWTLWLAWSWIRVWPWSTIVSAILTSWWKRTASRLSYFLFIFCSWSKWNLWSSYLFFLFWSTSRWIRPWRCRFFFDIRISHSPHVVFARRSRTIWSAPFPWWWWLRPRPMFLRSTSPMTRGFASTFFNTRARWLSFSSWLLWALLRNFILWVLTRFCCLLNVGLSFLELRCWLMTVELSIAFVRHCFSSLYLNSHIVISFFNFRTALTYRVARLRMN